MENVKAITQQPLPARANYFSVLLYMAVGLPVLFVLPDTDNMPLITTLSLLLLLSGLLAIKLCKQKCLSLPCAFLVFSYIFHFGHYILQAYQLQPVRRTINMFERYPWEILIQAQKVCVQVHFFLILGMLLAFMWERPVPLATNPHGEDHLRFLSQASLVLIVVSIVPSLYIDFNKIILMLRGGYANTFGYAEQTGGMIYFLTSLWKYGLILYLIANRKYKQRCTLVFLAGMFLLGISMLSGGRMTALLFAIVTAYFYFTLVVRLRARTFLILAVGGYLALNVVVQIGLERFSAISIGNLLKFVSPWQLLYIVLSEFGGTIASVAVVVDHTPTVADWGMGGSYIYGLLMVLPNLDGFLQSFMGSINYLSSYPPELIGSLGGSYIGELYYNFGIYGQYFACLVGFLVASISLATDRLIKQQHWIPAAALISTYPYLLMWVRSYFKDMVRPFFWQGLLLFLLYCIFMQLRSRIRAGGRK